jgi:hypothetical protein
MDFDLKINRVPDSPKDYVCTKFGQNPLKDVDFRVFTRMLNSKTKRPTEIICSTIVNTLESTSFNGF